MKRLIAGIATFASLYCAGCCFLLITISDIGASVFGGFALILGGFAFLFLAMYSAMVAGDCI